jgi:hypothetical protein
VHEGNRRSGIERGEGGDRTRIFVQTRDDDATDFLKRALGGRLELSHRNHIITAELDAVRILLPRRKNIHDPTSPSVFPMGIDEILPGIPEISQSTNQPVMTDGFSWFQFTKQLSQFLRSGDWLEKPGKIGYKEGGRRFVQPVQA